jgi:hypothetical protein
VGVVAAAFGAREAAARARASRADESFSGSKDASGLADVPVGGGAETASRTDSRSSDKTALSALATSVDAACATVGARSATK